MALLAALAAVVVTSSNHASASAGANGDPATSSLIHRLDSCVPPRQRPTIVLVHGAWADSSSWRGEISTLQAAGFPVRAVGNPLENLATDAEFVAGFLKAIPGPIVLVGHSYGGAVITNAATGNRNVKALVYVDAAAPAPGETNGQLSGPDSILARDTPAELFQDTAIPGAPAGVHELYLNEDIFVHDFASDLPRSQAQELWASQRGASQAAFDTPSKTAAWKTIPSWYFISTEDQIITPASELAMAKRARSHITVFHGGSHLTLISHPNAVTATIASAACSLRRPSPPDTPGPNASHLGGIRSRLLPPSSQPSPPMAILRTRTACRRALARRAFRMTADDADAVREAVRARASALCR